MRQLEEGWCSTGDSIVLGVIGVLIVLSGAYLVCTWWAA